MPTTPGPKPPIGTGGGTFSGPSSNILSSSEKKPSASFLRVPPPPPPSFSSSFVGPVSSVGSSSSPSFNSTASVEHSKNQSPTSSPSEDRSTRLTKLEK